jgi:hypothetical protein
MLFRNQDLHDEDRLIAYQSEKLSIGLSDSGGKIEKEKKTNNVIQNRKSGSREKGVGSAAGRTVAPYTMRYALRGAHWHTSGERKLSQFMVCISHTLIEYWKSGCPRHASRALLM